MGVPVFEKRCRLNKERALELYNKGYCDQQIADECDASVGSVREWRRRIGLPGHRVLYKKKTKKRESTLVELAAEAKAHGMSYGEYMAARREGKV